MSRDQQINVALTGNPRDMQRAFDQGGRSAEVFGVKLAAVAASAKRSKRDIDANTASVNRSADSMSHLEGVMGRTAKTGELLGANVKLLKFPALITGAGLAAQALVELGAAGVGVVSAITPAAGAIAALPAAATSAAQGLGVLKLATHGVADALGGLNAKVDPKKLAALTPEAQRFVGVLDALKPRIRDLQRGTQAGLFPGLEKGLGSLHADLAVLDRRLPHTARVLGQLGADAGKLAGSKGFVADLDTQLQRNDVTLRRGGQSGLYLADALRHVTIAAGPLVDHLSAGGEHLAKLIDQEAKAGRESGRLGRFFDDTSGTLDRLGSIAGHTASGLLEIGRAARPLGNDILRSLDDATGRFDDWSHSVKGHHELREYFTEAQPAVHELGGLVGDIGGTLLRLGSGDQVAPLIHQIRTELLPIFEQVVSNTTTAFGPHLISALGEIALLFGHLAGPSGPLTMFVDALGEGAHLLNTLLDTVPGLNAAVVTLAGLGGIAKAMQLGAAITGTNRLIGLTKKLTGVQAGATAVNIAGGAGGGVILARGPKSAGLAAPGRAGRAAYGPAFRSGAPVSQLGPRSFPLPIGGLLGAAGAAIAVSPFLAPQIGQAIHGTAGIQRQVFGSDPLGKLAGGFKGDSRGLAQFSDDARKDLHAVSRQLGITGADVAAFSAKVDTALQQQAAPAFAKMRAAGGKSMRGLKQDVFDTTFAIEQKLGSGTRAGKEALAHNFELAAQAVKKSMASGAISTKQGTALMNTYLRQALSQFGISNKQANRYISGHDTLTGVSDSIVKATGGFIGSPGERGRDEVDITVGRGEFVANHDQQSPINFALGVTAAQGLQPFHHLGELAGHGRKHYMAAGGFAGMVSMASAIDRRQFNYEWGGGHNAAFSPTHGTGHGSGPGIGYDCSGAVSAVLHAGGRLSMPMTSGQLMSYGKPGPGTVTWYASPSHTYMSLGGRYFGTSNANPGGGAGWFDGAPRPGFVVRHIDAANPTLKHVKFPGGLGYVSALGQGELDTQYRADSAVLNATVAGVGLGQLGGGDAREKFSGGGFAGKYTATSYGPPWGGIQGSGVTRTGVNLKGSPHTYGIAVDPSVIPLGSMVNVSPNPFAYRGAFKAFDTGGAIKGHHIDFYDWRGRKAQRGWGRRTVSVTPAGAKKKGGSTKTAQHQGITVFDDSSSTPGGGFTSYGQAIAKGDTEGFVPGIGGVFNNQTIGLPSYDGGGGGTDAKPDDSAAQALAQALVDAIKELKDQMKRQSDFADGVLAVTSHEAVRMMADLISGQVSSDINTRARTAGSGQVSRL